MTIHQAKGLEFQVVVVPSAMEGRLPTRKRREHYEVPYELRASGAPEVEDPHLVDERKLFYVATTRARELLILGTADIVNKRGGGPSLFLREMLGDDLDAFVDITKSRIDEIESRVDTHIGPRERLSFSQIAYFLQCPVRFKFSVIYGLEIPKPDPVDFGANVHRALLVIHERAKSGQIVHPDEIEDIIDTTWMPALRADPVQEQEAKKAANLQLQHYVTQHAESLTQVDQAEMGFSFDLDQHVVVGKIDLLRRTEMGYELVDFKVGHSTREALLQVGAQLDLYALGAEASLHFPIKNMNAHFLADNHIYTVNWSLSRAELVQKTYENIVNKIINRDFKPRRTYCVHCTEFREICPYKEG
jgi:DNA helicase-2/ATP-dependent DNA helicase PcrA